MPLLRRSLAQLALPALTSALAGCGADIALPSDATPATIVVVSGDEQTGTAGSRLPQPLVVEVRDAQGRPVPGVSVGFRFAHSAAGAALSPGSAQTSATGRAATRVDLPDLAGSQIVEAYLTGAGMPALRATFLLTARAAAAEGSGSSDGGNGKDKGGGKGGKGKGGHGSGGHG
ncbi:MAG TPA: Ig-like domain-containing protein [Gemmatimonadales bacterium]|nr:Ig-like domain-containing protein [Gemmatimonadales bacterium]